MAGITDKTFVNEECKCPVCKASCNLAVERGYDDLGMLTETMSYLDCDCGYVSIVEGNRCFEREPGFQGVAYKWHDRAGTEIYLKDWQTQKIIESRRIDKWIMQKSRTMT